MNQLRQTWKIEATVHTWGAQSFDNGKGRPVLGAVQAQIKLKITRTCELGSDQRAIHENRFSEMGGEGVDSSELQHCSHGSLSSGVGLEADVFEYFDRAQNQNDSVLP